MNGSTTGTGSRAPSPDREALRALLARVRELEIRARRPTEAALAGGYHAVFRGSGIEFEEAREYVAGDDVRAIDWNVTARAGRLFVKKYREERERVVLLVVDASASTGFGSGARAKFGTAVEAAAALALSAARTKDRVGLVLFADRVLRYVPPRKGRGHLLVCLRELLAAAGTGRGTDVAGALSFVRGVAKRRAVVFLLSDFEAPDFSRRLSAVAGRHELVPLVLRDPLERELSPALGLVRLEDPERGGALWFDAGSARARAAFAAAAAARDEALLRLFRRHDIDPIVLAADEDYRKVLLAYFHRRARRY